MRLVKDPDILRLVDGQLVCSDGTDAREYLRQWAIDKGVAPDRPINIIAGDCLAELRWARFVYENHAA